MTEDMKVQTLKVARKTFTMLSEHRTQILDITKTIRDVMLSADIKEGILLVNSLHTTCALFVNEFQGALVEDLKSMIETLVAENDGYRHDDPRYSDCERGNAHSHLRAALLGRSVAVGISGGELSLGRFQSILFAAFVGPRPRNIVVQIIGVDAQGPEVSLLASSPPPPRPWCRSRHGKLTACPGSSSAKPKACSPVRKARSTRTGADVCPSPSCIRTVTPWACRTWASRRSTST